MELIAWPVHTGRKKILTLAVSGKKKNNMKELDYDVQEDLSEPFS